TPRSSRCARTRRFRWERRRRRFSTRRSGSIPTSSRSSPIRKASRSISRARRSPICGTTGRDRSSASSGATATWAYTHTGGRDFLVKFARMRPSALEQSEKLEQLRALSNGYRIRVADVDETAVEVDTPADLEKAEEYLRSESNNPSRRRTAHG